MPVHARIVDDERSDVVRVGPVGEVDLASADEFRRLLDGACALRRRTVVVDLAGVPFLDCRGVGVLIGMQRRLHGEGATLALDNAPALVATMIDALGLSGMLPVQRVARPRVSRRLPRCRTPYRAGRRGR